MELIHMEQVWSNQRDKVIHVDSFPRPSQIKMELEKLDAESDNEGLETPSQHRVLKFDNWAEEERKLSRDQLVAIAASRTQAPARAPTHPSLISQPPKGSELDFWPIFWWRPFSAESPQVTPVASSSEDISTAKDVEPASSLPPRRQSAPAIVRATSVTVCYSI